MSPLHATRTSAHLGRAGGPSCHTLEISSKDPGPSWLDDPMRRGDARWWDGAGWTRWITRAGQVLDEGQIASAVVADANARLQALVAQPHLRYIERAPAEVGGRIDVVAPDGRIVASAQADEPSTRYGDHTPDVLIHMIDADGTLLGTLVRGRGQIHPVLDAAGNFQAELLGPHGTKRSHIRTPGGVVGMFTVQQQENWLVDSANQPIAKVIHAENFRISPPMHVLDAKRNRIERSEYFPDTFILEPFRPVAPWWQLLAILAPVEANLRVDTLRVMWGSRNQM